MDCETTTLGGLAHRGSPQMDVNNRGTKRIKTGSPTAHPEYVVAGKVSPPYMVVKERNIQSGFPQFGAVIHSKHELIHIKTWKKSHL